MKRNEPLTATELEKGSTRFRDILVSLFRCREEFLQRGIVYVLIDVGFPQDDRATAGATISGPVPVSVVRDRYLMAPNFLQGWGSYTAMRAPRDLV